MNLIIHTQPCLFLEAIELIHAMVNQVPASRLSGTRGYAIPEEQFARLREQACQGFPLDSEDVQFFFLGVPCEEKSSDPCSVARHMVYSLMEDVIPEPRAMVEALCRTWKEYAPHPLVNGVRRYFIDIGPGESGGFRSLSRELRKLPLPLPYQMQLVEAFSNYDVYIYRLLELLNPVMERLESLLEPWVRGAAPLVEQWQALFSDPEKLTRFASSRLCMGEPRFTTLNFGLRYLQPFAGVTRCQLEGGIANILMGVGLEVNDGGAEACDIHPLQEDLMALRLLSGPDRMAMLQAMLHKPMTGLELSQQLGLHSGSVFRDINSMNQVDFLIKEDVAGKKAYRTNAPMLRQLLVRVAQIFETENP